MPTAIINYCPPPIPGLRVMQVGNNEWSVTGAVDALNALGIKQEVKKSRLVIPLTHVPLFPFQREGINLMSSVLATHGGALLADDMGLG